jgi:putative tricarboxylic transport membrane protein
MITADRVLGLALIAVAVGAMLHVQGLTVPFAADPVGPRAFPTVVAVALGACGALMLVSPGARWPRAERWLPGVVVVAGMVAYALLLTTLGFVPATVLLAALIALAFGARPAQAAITGAVVAPALWLLLDQLLDLPLPGGVLGN